jgi:hypothetical protein
LRGYPSVGVFQADDVVFAELPKGDLEYPYRLDAGGREAVLLHTRNEDLFTFLRVEDSPTHFHPSPGI